jgi:hypothetical protein
LSAGARESLGAADGSAGGGESDLLGLFNQARASEGGWILAPFRFSLGDVAFAGSFRLQLPRIPGGPFRFESSFEARSGRAGARPGTWELSLGGGGVSRLLELRSPRKLPPVLVAALEGELAGLGVRLLIREGGAEGGLGSPSGESVDIRV